MKEMPALPETPCKCFDGEADETGCACGASERVLRHVIRGGISLTAEQREWALQEIDSVEGYSRADFDTDDQTIAHGVLSAWTDYCRDKGLM